MCEVTFNFPAISYNTYYRVFRNRYVISLAGRNFRDKVQAQLQDYQKVPGKIKVEVEFFYKDRKIRDIDNALKSIIDACKGHLFEDDSDIFEFNAKKFIGQPENKIILKISQLVGPGNIL